MTNTTPLTENEKRQKAVDDLQILEMVNETAFDDLARLASLVAETPIAAISFCSNDRLWLKSKVGVDISDLPVSESACNVTLKTMQTTLSENMDLDSRFKNLNAVQTPGGVKFYFGIPLVNQEGHALGTLCVSDTKPKTLTDTQKQSIELIAKQAMSMLDNRAKIIKNGKIAATLKDREDVLSSFFASSPQILGIVELRGDEIVLMAQNREGKTQYGKSVFDQEEEVAKEAELSKEELEVWKKNYRLAQETAKPVKFLQEITVHGNSYWLSCTVNHMRNAPYKHPRFSYIIENITEDMQHRRELSESQQKLIQNAKMASLGTMAGGIAHEINNPLAIISGKADQLLSMVARGDLQSELFRNKLTENLEKIRHTAIRISKITHGLLSFSRSEEKSTKGPVGVASIVNEVIDISQERLKGLGVTVNASIDETFVVKCDRVQISQVLLNLFNNATDAMKDLPEKWLRIEAKHKGSVIEISVVDAGGGIPKEVRERIFDPFFTTKGVGSGVGLGLSISQAILKAHAGQLSIDEKSQNTCFKLSLPAVLAAEAEIQAAA